MTDNIIYLDNAATTAPCENAVKAMIRAAECFGNPSSLHGLGLKAEKLIRSASQTISSMLGVDSKNILFTSGGTEANNTAVFGAAEARKKLGTRIITSSIEHPSVLEAFRKLEGCGFDVAYIDVDSDGIINLDSLERTADDNTVLVSIMHVNNETGVIQPVEKVRDIINKKSPVIKVIF